MIIEESFEDFGEYIENTNGSVISAILIELVGSHAVQSEKELIFFSNFDALQFLDIEMMDNSRESSALKLWLQIIAFKMNAFPIEFTVQVISRLVLSFCHGKTILTISLILHYI